MGADDPDDDWDDDSSANAKPDQSQKKPTKADMAAVGAAVAKAFTDKTETEKQNVKAPGRLDKARMDQLERLRAGGAPQSDAASAEPMETDAQQDANDQESVPMEVEDSSALPPLPPPYRWSDRCRNLRPS